MQVSDTSAARYSEKLTQKWCKRSNISSRRYRESDGDLWKCDIYYFNPRYRDRALWYMEFFSLPHELVGSLAIDMDG